MKIAIPTEEDKGLDSKVSEHFGRANYYTLLDENGKVVKIIENTSEDKGGSGLPPELIKKEGANILLCKGIGPRAIELCKKLGIEIFMVRGEKVRECFEEWRSNSK